jgi:acyl-CoA reductase-like NAD-dependent aldehyde dehydrogenase
MSETASLPPLRIVSPASGEFLAEVPDEGAEGALLAVARARAAAPAWAGLPFGERAGALKRWRTAALDSPDLITTLVGESGKPRHEAEAFELLYFCELIRYGISVGRRALATESRHPFLFMTKRTDLTRKPLGVVGVIGPWNFPLLNNAADAVFPLLAGNAVVLKPSEVTPLTSVLLGKLWAEAGNPPGVFQAVTGLGATGAALLEEVDGVMFTGSVQTGRKVAAKAGERLIPCVTELGGKSPFIVLEGADLDAAAGAAVWSGFAHSGQICIRTERVYVEEAVADEFEKKLADRVRALRQEVPGRGESGEHDLGSVTSPLQIEVVERHVADALGKGARAVTGGKRRTGLPGNFFEPTLLLGATQEMDVMREETFGPLLPVMRVKDAAEAVRLANDSPLGLNASVFGPEEKAVAVAHEMQSGNTIVNDVLVHYLIVEAPLGGIKASGLGVRHGIEGFRQWTRLETVTVNKPLLGPISRYLSRKLGFPYDRRVLGLIRKVTRLLYR